METKCSKELLALRKQLQHEMHQEEIASLVYFKAGTAFSLENLGLMAETMKSLATDELLHHFMLKGIVETITEKCGEEV